MEKRSYRIVSLGGGTNEMNGFIDQSDPIFILAGYVKLLLQFRTDIKLYHWQTKSFAHHKISDELLGSIDDLSDKTRADLSPEGQRLYDIVEGLKQRVDEDPSSSNNESNNSHDPVSFVSTPSVASATRGPNNTLATNPTKLNTAGGRRNRTKRKRSSRRRSRKHRRRS